MDYTENDDIELSFSDILFVLWKGKKTILIISIAGFTLGIIMMFLNALMVKDSPQYVMSAAIAINSQNESGIFASNSMNPNSQDVYLAQNLADSVIYVATSGKVLNTVIEKLQLVNITASSLKRALKLNQYEDSQIIQISFLWENPQEGIAILSEITKVLPDYLIDTLKIGSVTVVDEPTTAVEVNNSYSLITAIILGGICFVVTSGIYIVRLIVRPTFLTGKEVESDLDIEVLGEIPRDEHLSEISEGDMIIKGDTELSILFQESFASTANILCHLLKKKQSKVILVTSTHSGEGKTTSTVNLAYNMSRLDYKVLMIDCDIRKPSLGGLVLKTFNKEHTLNAVYYKETEAHKAIIELQKNLYILPCYLEKRRMIIDEEFIQIINTVATNFDYVFLDTAPIGLVSDIMRLNEVVDATIYVIRQNKVWKELVFDSVQRLIKIGFPFIGCIVNDININTPGNKYYYKNYEKEYDVYEEKRASAVQIEKKIKQEDEGVAKSIKSYKKFENKTLLILGSDVTTVDMVNYAKENGAYTIVVDHLPVEKSEAKQKADKSLRISTTESKLLTQIVKEHSVDGILARINDFDIVQAIQLSEETGVPFYCTREQKDKIELQDEFRTMCMNYTLSCDNASELEGKCLTSERNAVKFTAIYMVVEGKAKLVSIDSSYLVAVNKSNEHTISNDSIYLSLFMDKYSNQVDAQTRHLCEDIGTKNGVVTIQGIYNKREEKFYLYEARLRYSIDVSYYFIREMTGHNLIQPLVDQVLLGKSDYPVEAEKEYHKGKVCAMVSLVGKGGIVRSVRGLERAVNEISSIVTYENRYPVGNVVPANHILQQVMIRFIMVCNNREELEKDIERINELVTVLDHKEESMIIQFDVQMVWDIK